MKNFALKHPFAASLIIFLCVFIGGTTAGIVFSFVILAFHNSPNPTPPNDGAAMAMGMIWILSFAASFILGILAGILSFAILILKIKSREDRSYK